MYELPVAAVTSDHKFRGSQQYKCITVYFWRSEVQDGFCWTRSRVYETTLFGYPLGENQFPCFSQLLKAAQFPWLMAPSSVFTADDVASSSLLLTLTLFLSSHLLPSCASNLKKNFFWPHCAVCSILVPQPVFEPVPPTVEGQSLNHWTTREVSLCFHTEKTLVVTLGPQCISTRISDNPGYPCHQNS